MFHKQIQILIIDKSDVIMNNLLRYMIHEQRPHGYEMLFLRPSFPAIHCLVGMLLEGSHCHYPLVQDQPKHHKDKTPHHK